MELNFDTLYKKGSNPLEKVNQPEEDKVYYTEAGRAIIVKEEGVYELYRGSLLVEKETMSNLTEKQLDLFWTIDKNIDNGVCKFHY